MKTLSVFSGGIGDLLLAGPAFAHLHLQGAHDLAGNPERLALIQDAGACENVFHLDRIEFHTLFDNPSEKLRDFVQQYDRVIVWMRDDGIICDALNKSGAREIQAHPGIPPDGWTHHAIEYYLQCVGADATTAPLRIHYSNNRPLNESLDVIIHPGSGSPTKNWPIEKFAAIAEQLQAAGRCVQWIRGPAEEDILYPAHAGFVATNNLRSLAQQLAGARLYIGNDSGITHLAAAVGCRTIAIFGPTNPQIWAPTGENVIVIADSPWPTLDAVCNALGSASR